MFNLSQKDVDLMVSGIGTAFIQGKTLVDNFPNTDIPIGRVMLLLTERIVLLQNTLLENNTTKENTNTSKDK